MSSMNSTTLERLRFFHEEIIFLMMSSPPYVTYSRSLLAAVRTPRRNAIKGTITTMFARSFPEPRFGMEILLTISFLLAASEILINGMEWHCHLGMLHLCLLAASPGPDIREFDLTSSCTTSAYTHLGYHTTGLRN